MTRKQSRDEAFKLLYQSDICRYNAEDILSIFYGENENIDKKAKDYISNVVYGVELNREEIDKTIESFLRGWNLNRISKLSAAALRLGVFEIKYCPDIPDTVAASEAVSLVKLYDSEESAGFVNGILASVIGGNTVDGNGKQS